MSGWLAGRRGHAAVAALVVAVMLIALAPSWHRPESAFDEGFALAYGARVLEGDVPHRDFVSFYGPGNPWLVAGTFAIGGVNQETERVLGALYRVMIVLGIAALAAPVGRMAALASAAMTIPLLLRIGFPAYAAYGALGFSLATLALLASLRGAPASHGRKRAALAGLAAGGVLLIRPEAMVPLAVAALPLLLGLPRARMVPIAVGLLPSLLAWVVHIAMVGVEQADRVLVDLRASGAGRSLPLDLSATEHWIREPSRLLFALVVFAATAGAATLLARQRRPLDPAWRGSLALALLALALVPYALSRLDYAHAVIAAIPAVAAFVSAAGLLRVDARHWLAIAAAAAAAAVLTFVAPQSVRAYTLDHGKRLLGAVDGPSWPEVRVDGRGFRLKAEAAEDLQPVLDAAVRAQRGGARSLFVGPGDLRRSNSNDAFIYYLLPDLEPASYYLELNPWTANRPGSGLAQELRRADLVILNHEWDDWDEPNASSRLGSDEPNRVVEEQFCRVIRRGSFELLRRCR